MSDRQSAIMAAMLKVNEEDFTKTGKPEVDALNDILELEGEDATNAKERNKFWKLFAEGSAVEEPAAAPSDEPAIEAGQILVKPDESMPDPVKVYVHGSGAITLPHEKWTEVSPLAFEALKDSDIRFQHRKGT